ncbi:7tm 2 domain containing protein [Asbolus verrucosus]|uniref:7tm 2 domain containing protein n=1 Tax=Asbolus verrucosus TaxID=1661398 RepID=A0A482W1W8_ASBVE|nr:7tm 2 domain containing protein [Asbolus verrucosus]
MRYCTHSGTWDAVEGECSDNISTTIITENLHDVLKANSSIALNVTLNITNSETFKEVKPIDIHFISKILDKASEDENIVNEPSGFNRIIDKIMGVEKNIIASSQQLLNSTDMILYNLDKILLKTKESKYASLPLLLVKTINISEGAIGVIIKNDENNEDFRNFQIISLYNDSYQNQLEDGNFEIAVLIPDSFTQNQDHYFITLFHNDNFFNQEESETEFDIGSWIISILIPDITTDSNSTIKIYYKESISKLNHQCNHWRYGNDEANLPIKGRWRADNNATKFKDGFYICEVNHTTHFGMLVSGSLPDNYILDFITIFGSILSIVGILIIFLTALIFKKWRNNPTSKIILNIAACLLLLIILFFISDQVPNGTSCIIVGILLHYMILAQFCWMLAISYSSFRRLSLRLHYHVENMMIKYCVPCWGIPLIIVGIVSAISVQTYDKQSDLKSSEICYPKGIYFKLGLLMPMGVILTINLIIYILIIKALNTTSFSVRKHTLGKSCSKQKSVILLFFMMGITWIFGFLVAFTDSIVFAYLFCTTATCHGFVMFVYYVLDATNTKQLWRDKMQKLFTKKSKRKQVSVMENTVQSVTE